MNSPQNKKLIYTFYNWKRKAYRILRQADLKDTNIRYIKNLREAHALAKHISESNYTHVLGIADMSKNAKRHRYETQFINRFRKSQIINGGKEKYFPTLHIQPSQTLYYSKTYTTSFCNRSAYLIAKVITENKLITQFAFVHINKNPTNEQIRKDILEWID